MTLIALPARAHGTTWLGELHRRNSAMTAAGLLLILTLLPLGLAGAFDTRMLAGVSVWDKPLRFAFALSVYLLTLAFFAGWMTPEARRSRLMRWTVTAGLAAIAFEQIWITVQASRGLPSHFNEATAFDAVMYALMGIAALVLTFMAPAVGLQIWRLPRAGLSPAMRSGAALGLLLTFPLTLITAGTLASNGGHFVGQAFSDASGLVFMGWSREVGDLRAPHFFATHAMHVIPAATAMLAPVFGTQRIRPALLTAAGYSLFVALVFAQALSGMPFLPLLG